MNIDSMAAKACHVTTVELERIQVEAAEMIGIDLCDARFTMDILPEISDRMRCRLKGYLLGDKHPDKVVKWPRTWWDAFKVDCFPEWAFDRWPPEYSYHTFSFVTLYPDYKPKLRPEQSPMVVQCYDYKT